MRILFDSKRTEYKTPFGVLTPGEVCVLHLQIPTDRDTSEALLILEREDGSLCEQVRFERQSRGLLYDTFRAEFTLTDCGLYFYWFRITAKTGPFRLFKLGDGTNMEAGDKWQLSCVPGEHTVPDWAKGAVIYQIFPDRFHKSGECDLTGKLKPYILRTDWGGEPEWRPNAQGQVLCNDFFGGNFKGITEKLDYLHSLKVGILYFNPISYAFSNHRYDTADYKMPDPMLGSEQDFRKLCRKAHSLGMRVILDGVYSHTGSNSRYFDCEGLFGDGACKGEGSPYYKWYHFRRFPEEYDCWWNFPTLPCLDKSEPSLLAYIIDDTDSVLAHWLALGADGVRLDVVDELPDSFVLRLKKRLRELKPDALLLGEVWEDASNKTAYGLRRRYFTDGELDSVMNYPWRTAIIRYVQGKDDGRELQDCLMTIAENYPPEVLQCTMNLLGSHDTARILTVLGHEFDGTREQQAAHRLTPEEWDKGKQRLQVAAFLQYVLPGCPSIYYGDEAGMEGCKDPFNRVCFPWGEEDSELVEFYRELGRLKTSCAALRGASLQVLFAGDGRICIARGSGPESVMACVNLSRAAWKLSPASGVLFGRGHIKTDALWLQEGGFALLQS